MTADRPTHALAAMPAPAELGATAGSPGATGLPVFFCHLLRQRIVPRRLLRNVPQGP
jgi:hypothetical protein